jgi:uncharacterized phage infection (PIP) family protein YhgE
MDYIDITDSTFSLDVPDINQDISGGGITNDYTMFIYIGAAILIAFIGMFIFKFYQNKNKNSDGGDCAGGFCTMERCPIEI